MRRFAAFALGTLCALAAGSAAAADSHPVSPRNARSGSEIYARFRDGLAEPDCVAGTGVRWQRQFAHASGDMANSRGDVMPLFGYVVDALREANLPTEFALIPFVESGYKPGARSKGGPAGLWQMITITARNHGVPIRPGYDGRLSPVESTRAAVRYLKTLYGMFAGDWRLTAMAYNAGEYRVLSALKHSGQSARNASPSELTGLSSVTMEYVRKLHALSCVLDEADDHAEWRDAIDRPIPLWTDVELPAGTDSLGAWAARNGLDIDALRRMNPAFANGRIGGGRPAHVLAPGLAPAAAAFYPDPQLVFEVPAGTHLPRSYTVRAGDSLDRIARRHGVTRAQLLQRNALQADAVLHPGMVLKID